MEARNDGVIDYETLMKELHWAQSEDKVKAVVMRVSSPGGSALVSDLIWSQVSKLAQVKPLVVSMGSVVASGGFYISAPAKKIFASNMTITGSIGVTSLMPKFTHFKDKFGVSFHTLTSSKLKSIFDRSRKLKPIR